MKGFIFVSVFFLMVFNITAQTKKDTIAIRQAVLDYIDGFYTASQERMEKALHPKLAKRVIYETKDQSKSMISEMGAENLVSYCKTKKDESKVHGKLDVKIEIFDIFGKIATAKASTEYFDFIDYCHLGKQNGEWKIINVLWEMKPKS